MIKLELPATCQNYDNIIDTCCSRMRKNSAYKFKIMQNKSDLIRISNSYMLWAKDNILFKYQYCMLKNEEPIRMGNILISELLTDEEMVKLYDDYFSEKDKPARKFYEKIINNAKDPKIQCPFCGGIGEPNELDHFLPKSGFGYYSIFPYNLIPICKDCNQKYKKTFYPIEKNKQLIHPYLDNDCFFDEQWLFANIIIDFDDITLSTVKFYVNPPHHWSDDKKGKVQFHFETFDLDRRFSTESIDDLGDLVDAMIRSKKNSGNIQDFISERLDTIINSTRYRINSWKKSLYQAIKAEINNIWYSIK